MKKYAHKTKIITLNGKKIKIDQEMVDLILSLNKLGLKTEFCCQGGMNPDNYKEVAYVAIDASNIEVCVRDNSLMIYWERK